LVDTYATVPYRDLDPVWFAALAYVVMFGMMFGDVGDGLLLVAGALLLRRSRSPRLAGVRRVWPLVLALGAMAAVFGLLYGEAFGPTGLVPTVWLDPLDSPEELLAAGVAVGAGLLACAYCIGIVNRWRESGPGGALWAPSGIAGAALFVGLGLVAGGVVWSTPALWASGLAVAAIGLVMAAVGLRSQAGPGGAGLMQAGVETFDLTLRLGSNVVSFARLAAFGLVHAAIAKVVWDATSSLWAAGILAWVGAIAVFVAGHVAAFALEALVAGVQALRLEYYELFSRIFVSEGRPFHPWHIPLVREEST
jgi:V/A-type H+-transporting ATPase subunit I